MIILKWIVVLVAGGYLSFVALLYLAQRQFLFHPRSAHPSPGGAGLPEAEEAVLKTADGERVIIWQVPPRGERPGGNLFPWQCRNRGLTDRAASRINSQWHRSRCALLPGLHGLDRKSDGGGPAARRRGRVSVRDVALSVEPGRVVGTFARIWRGGCARRSASCHQGHLGGPVLVDCRCCSHNLSARAGPLAYARSIPLGSAHRRCSGSNPDHARS
jgi:hypothetical protein